MTPELTALALAGLVQSAQYFSYMIAGQRQLGRNVAMGTRDNAPDLSGNAARIKRALDNHFEGLVMFTLAVVVVTLGNQSSVLTATCAYIYVVARILYVFCYVYGLTPWRSYVWFAGLVATIMMIIAALIP
ncbi:MULTISPECIES: MAPEG family protein [Falsihalocynthiibacter]|uniref:MAPEG family protein n=1 Tax=Falsihalocynthiibacter TaxID=2854182 RepID=UPI0030037046